MQGRSFKPILEGNTPNDWRQSFYYHYYEFPGAHSVRRHEGVATKEFKLIHFYDLDEWEFYDIRRDPHELRSLYAHPDYQDEVAELKEELARLKDHYEVTPPPPLREE